MVIFNVLCVLDSILNFVCAVFAYYPAFDTATKFLVFNELFRVRREIKDRLDHRQGLEATADQKVTLAKSLDDGKN